MGMTGYPVRCGIVLAAGEGRRLQPFVRRLRGDDLPKQFVEFAGARSMLEQTLSRAETLVPPDRLVTVVGACHFDYPEVRRQLLDRPRRSVIRQPENKETGPGLLLPLLHLVRRYPYATIAVFPSDHYVREEALFMHYVEIAYRAVEKSPSRIVLLGAEPDRPESEYGYILPGAAVNLGAPHRLHPILRFIEKPSREAAERLIEKRAIWNTFVMVFRAKTMLDLVRAVSPRLYRFTVRIARLLGAPDETNRLAEVYQTIHPMNFSRDVLEPLSRMRSRHLFVLPVRGVRWSDWGSEDRVVEGLDRIRFATETNSRVVQSAEAGAVG